MNTEPCTSDPPGFWGTVRLLLGVARRRAVGRSKRQQELLRQRTGKKAATDTLGWLGLIAVIIMMALLNVGAAFVVQGAIWAGQRLDAEHNGRIVVGKEFLEAIREAEFAASDSDKEHARKKLDGLYYREARNRSRDYVGSEEENERMLREAVGSRKSNDFIDEDTAEPGIGAIARTGPFPAMLGSMVLLWWFVMMVFQGEGLELDLQRRRHPMWEWLFSHPIPAGAIFLAEMLSPIAANPIYCTAPFFLGFLYGSIYGTAAGIAAGILLGIPIAVATACLGKALEIGITLRFSARSRGAVIGLMGWIGYASMMLFIFGAFAMTKIVGFVGEFFRPLIAFPWPWLGWIVGAQSDGSFSFISGMVVCWLLASAMIILAVCFSVWGAQVGLGGITNKKDLAPSALKINHTPRFGSDPLYKKEVLWFIRDRSAIVQTILIPLTIASFQLFNLRGVVQGAQSAWYYLSGAAIVFGTYFLWILGPRSLASEGPALWLSLTWPRGLESLLKAKAWLWSIIATGVVILVLAYTALRFPQDAWKVLLVGVGWLAFGRSMAEKAVTLVSAPSSSGEPEPIPKGRRWAASLGMLTFGIGILTQRWHIAIMGIVYSWVTAAAMWQNFRARLPFLYDPWSERLPPPPTLMHAMIAISALVEGGAIATGLFILFVGVENIALAQAVMYGFCAVIASLFVSNFLTERGVAPIDVWRWRTNIPTNLSTNPLWSGDGSMKGKLYVSLAIGLFCGLVLGLFANGYVSLLLHFPTIAEMVHQAHEQMGKVPGLKISYAIMAVAFAPFAEEYLFRGLLFKALDREWGGWRAVVGSAAFFAIYHPPIAWVPVGIVGVVNALLFKKTGRLAPAVVLHMAYNTVVLTTF